MANRNEKGSKPASRANTKEMSPAISLVPLIPIDDWDIALGAPVHIDDRPYFWIRYKAPGGVRKSQGAPWLIQAPPTSTAP